MTTFKHLIGIVLLSSLLLLPAFANQEQHIEEPEFAEPEIEASDASDASDDTSNDERNSGNSEPEVVEMEYDHVSGEKRALLNYPNLRVYVDYEHVFDGEGSPEFNQYIATHLGPSIQNYFQAALKVRHPLKSNITSTKTTLCGYSTPKSLQNGGVAADVFVMLNSRNAKDKNWIAITTICTVASNNGVTKPLIFNIGINERFMDIATYGETFLTHDQNINTLMHEFIHGFAMSGSLYKYFVDENDQPLQNHSYQMDLHGDARKILDLPPLTKRLKAYYGCDSVPGVIMENDGGAHLERRYFLYDLMSNGGIIGSRITEITLGFLEGSGWYVPDYCYAEPYNFGQGQGCGFIFDDCDAKQFEEFCEGESKGCTVFGESGGSCKSDSKSDTCSFNKGSVYYNCENPKGIYYTTLASKQVYGRGLGSKCFAGNLTSSKTGTPKDNTYCFTYKCLGKGSDTVLQVNFGTDTFDCTKKGLTTIKGYYGFVTCPDPVEFCTGIGKPTCRKACMGNGKCVDGECECFPGWQGTDCAFAV